MLNAGMVIGGRYEILGKIGSGGMSIVYKGKDQKLNRNVAIKVLKAEYREDKNFVRKFREEAQAAARLAHPNIVNVYDVGEENGIHYIVMELVEGITLKNYIERKGKLTIKEATSIGIQVSMGLEVAHNNEIVHRDIKPQNIMISKDGKVKVMDFGIAKAASSETIASNAMGSVHYTSPEQARGGYSDAKSDIYSLGIVMFEMVTGRVPFDGETTVAVAVKHLQEEMPSPKFYCPELPVSLEKIICKCTEKVAARRYANMAELIADLKQSLQTPEVDFVKQNNVDEVAKTVMITKEELPKIKKEAGKVSKVAWDDEETGYDEEYEDEDEEDVDDYEDDYDDEDDDEEMDPRLERIMTIGGIAAAIIILIIIIMLIGKIVGFGKFGAGDSPEQPTVEDTVGDTVEMIDVKGMTWDEAKTALNQRGLGITSGGSEETEEYEDGQIMRQSVEPGTMIEKNTTIEVVTAVKKLIKVEIPGLEDQTEEDATYRLEQLGFKVDYSEGYSDKIKEGKVIKSSPEAGTEAAEGSTIVLTISKGKETKYTTVPSLVGKTKAEAESLLSNAKLTGNATEEYSNEVAAGVVISQRQSSGAEAEEGSTVNYVISKGPEVKYTSVPSLVGKTSGEAMAALEGAKLAGSSTEEYSNEVAAGVVISQKTAAGSEVEEGTTVEFVVSKGAKPVENPPADNGGTQTPPADNGGTQTPPADNGASQTPADNGGGEAAVTGTN